MILLPEVLAETASAHRVDIEILVPRELSYFDDHFPGYPLLPGVVQVDWAIRFARSRSIVAGGFSALENLKFLSPILPDTRLVMSLKSDDNRLDFTYADGKRRYSSGRVVFGDQA